jgi:integrase/recombinase XerD
MIAKRGVKRRLVKANTASRTVEDLYDEFIEDCKARNLTASTITSYNGSKKKFLDFVGEEALIKDIETSTINSFINDMLDDLARYTTINHYLRDLRAFFNWCYDIANIDINVIVNMIKGQEEVIETYTDEELEELLAKPNRVNNFVEWRSWAIITFIMATGARSSTIRNIKMGDILYGRSEVKYSHTKNKKVQLVPISKALMNDLRIYVKKWRGEASDDSFLFCDIGEEQLSSNGLKLSIRRYNNSRGVKRTSIHAFRHTFAKHWIRNTGDVFRLQKLLGHSTLEMTRRYVTLFSEDLKENLEAYNPLDRLKAAKSRRQAVHRTDS